MFAHSYSETARAFNDKIVFVYVDTENDDYGKAMVDHFGITEDSSTVIAYAGHLDGRKFLMEGDITLDNIMDDGDVKIVVGKNYEEIVLDESKDVLLEIYAPWCQHSRTLEPIYNRLARYMAGVSSIVIAKMDGSRNEHPKLKVDEFPTILFFPAAKKIYDPVTLQTDRTVLALYDFLKKQASIPFIIKELEDEQNIHDVDVLECPTSNDEHNDEL